MIEMGYPLDERSHRIYIGVYGSRECAFEIEIDSRAIEEKSFKEIDVTYHENSATDTDSKPSGMLSYNFFIT